MRKIFEVVLDTVELCDFIRCKKQCEMIGNFVRMSSICGGSGSNSVQIGLS